MRPSTMTPMVMYWPASNGVASPSIRTQKYARLSCWSSRRTSVALYWGRVGVDDPGVLDGVGHDAMVPAGSVRPPDDTRRRGGREGPRVWVRFG